MKVISIANQKGGVGKTTTAIEIGHCLADTGYKVLLIDFDQQSNLTKYLDAIPQTDSNGVRYDINAVMDTKIKVEDAIVHKEKVDVLPASSELSVAEKKYTETDDVYLLADICEMLEKQYDFIIVDNSPARNLLLTMAYIASDYVVVPTECDEGALDGILAIESDISKLRDSKHKFSHAKIVCLLLNKYEKTMLHSDALEILELFAATKVKGNPVVSTIRKSIKTSESKTARKSLQQHKHFNNVAIDYRRATKEILARIEEDTEGTL
jgi:chromosome partitioning protein